MDFMCLGCCTIDCLLVAGFGLDFVSSDANPLVCSLPNIDGVNKFLQASRAGPSVGYSHDFPGHSQHLSPKHELTSECPDQHSFEAKVKTI